jgi:hypothetical protein
MHQSNVDNLWKINQEAGKLIDVEYVLFGGDPNFRITVILKFEALTAYFIAESDYDTIKVAFDCPTHEPEHQIVTKSKEFPWQTACGRSVCWAWSMANQQGYADGVRLEFSNPDKKDSVFIEMVVAASSIELFSCVAAPWVD